MMSFSPNVFGLSLIYASERKSIRFVLGDVWTSSSETLKVPDPSETNNVDDSGP